MEIKKIIQEKDNPLFSRKEIILDVSSEMTPDSANSIKVISKKFSTPEEAVKIKMIQGSFGSKNFLINVNLYDSLDSKNKFERKTKKELEKEKAELEAQKKAVEEKKD